MSAVPTGPVPEMLPYSVELIVECTAPDEQAASRIVDDIRDTVIRTNYGLYGRIDNVLVGGPRRKRRRS